MKTFILILLCCVACDYTLATATEAQVVMMRKYRDECIAEHGVDISVIQNIIKTGEIVHTEKLDCFASCFLKKLGVQRADGTLDEEYSLQLVFDFNIDVSKASLVIEKCKNFVGENHCEVAGLAFDCFFKHKTYNVLG